MPSEELVLLAVLSHLLLQLLQQYCTLQTDILHNCSDDGNLVGSR